MILTDREILWAMDAGEIVITPFEKQFLGTNSYDVHLSPYIFQYKNRMLFANQDNPGTIKHITKDGFMMKPGVIYLGSTLEYTECHKHVPFLEGKSSTGRLGISIHSTAGKGDIGFCNHWTMELSVVQPVVVYAGMPIGQLIFHSVQTAPLVTYDKKESAKYNRFSAMPQPSRMYLNFE